MYKIIACDLDETLIGKNRIISEENKAAIRKCHELGIKFVPATGRGYMTVQGTLEDLGLKDLKDEYVISFNGGAISENCGNKVMEFTGISFDFASELYRRGLEYDVCIHVYTKDKVYAYNLNEDEARYVKGRQEMIEVFDKNLDFLKGQEIVKCLYERPDYDYLRKIEEDLKPITGDSDVSYSSGRYIEFNKKGVNKGAGLVKLAGKLGVDIKDTIAIGDNFNDLSMIKAAGLGVGVNNTAEDMKQFCDVITDADCDHGAVAEVI
ncbi:MAG: Cof-type HAD-IIB family hydrolase, partial [Lachnospiraceae bacterium]|nr:Cof-type HAD-IIB family hydrolase [Lachnospiraceae bacterium]